MGTSRHFYLNLYRIAAVNDLAFLTAVTDNTAQQKGPDPMFCPSCGGEANEGQHYCRACGTNLKVIGKVVSFSDAIAKTDTVTPQVKEKVAHVAGEVSRAMSKMNRDFARSSAELRRKSRWRKPKTAEERRERHLTRGFIKLGWGGGLSIFLYAMLHAVELRLPADVVAKVPFAIDSVVRMLWTIGLIPMLSGVGHIVAGLTIRPQNVTQLEDSETPPLRIDSPDSNPADPELTKVTLREPPSSITDRTTNILDRDKSWQKSNAN